MNIAPTPWKIGRPISRAVYAADETPICICDSMGEATPAQEANHARLIAAAPELLAACVEALSLFDNYPEAYECIGTYEVLTAAIAKATAHQ